MTPNPVTLAEQANTLAIKWLKESIWWLRFFRHFPGVHDLLVQRRALLDDLEKRKPTLGFKSRPRNVREKIQAPLPPVPQPSLDLQ